MNIKEYIESGILELYALGQCSGAEQLQVQHALSEHLELRSELAEIERALQHYAEANAVAPSPSVKVKVMQLIEEEERNNKKVVPINSGNTKTKTNWWLAAASILFLLGSVSLNFLQYKKNNSLVNEIANLNDKNTTLASDMEISRANYSESKRIFAFVNDTATKTIIMNGLPNYTAMKATVYWNKNSTEVYVAANNLSALHTNEDYQLWAIVDGLPVDAGVINITDSASFYKMNSFATAQAFAITVEKKGGSLSPTLEKMVLVGNS